VQRARTNRRAGGIREQGKNQRMRHWRYVTRQLDDV
jgi:hypothetical protein